MSGQTNIPRNRRRIALEFLGSMNLAITILIAIAIAAVIGTVLKQNQPYTDYIFKFGPFWHKVFVDLGLYDVYGTVWFLALMGFLLVSTSVCIYRNGPTLLRDMFQYRESAQERTLRTLRNHREWVLQGRSEDAELILRDFIKGQGYRTRDKRIGNTLTIAGKKGSLNRLGYLFTHAGIVVICIGALIGGSLGLRLEMYLGHKRIETRDIPVSQVPESSKLAAGETTSFRGNVTIPEGTSTNVVFLNMRDGYLVQELPFSIALKDFRIKHYPSGKPKDFQSDIVVHDARHQKILATTIRVNHPLSYRGYTIYQASFGDGGSKLQLRAWPLFSGQLKPLDLKGVIHQDLKVNTSRGPMTLEFSNFKAYNVMPAPPNSGHKFTNIGPSFIFKLRNASGVAKQYDNYMSPVLQDGRLFFLSGVRDEPGQPYQFLHIPADANASPKRFLKFEALLNNVDQVRAIASRQARETMAAAGMDNPRVRKDVTDSMVRLVGLFDQGGFKAIIDHIKKNVPKARQAGVTDAYSKVLQSILRSVYVELLHQEGVDTTKGVGPKAAQFYNDSINAINEMSKYGSPFYLQLTGFKEVQASGLEISKAPGNNIVFLGFILLIGGVFMSLYINHRRLWAIVRRDGEQTRVLFAGNEDRHQRDFARDFTAMGERLDGYLRR